MRQKLDSHRRNSIYSLPSSPLIHHPGRVEACELNHYALESRRRAGREVEEDGSLAGALNGDTNTRKNRHEIGAGVYYTKLSVGKTLLALLTCFSEDSMKSTLNLWYISVK